YANKKGFSKHKPALPLYDGRDVERTMKLFTSVPRGQWFAPAAGVSMRYYDAGHLLGSNMIEAEVDVEAESGLDALATGDSDSTGLPPAVNASRSRPLRILFSGDVGRYGGPLYHDP